MQNKFKDLVMSSYNLNNLQNYNVVKFNDDRPAGTTLRVGVIGFSRDNIDKTKVMNYLEEVVPELKKAFQS